MAETKPTQFGVNLNNREPLIAPDYDLQALLDLSERVEELGFDSVWVGDSLFSKPRYEAMTLLAAISQRTRRVRLGTACLVSSMRNPLYLALEWATLDALSGGRTILGPCMGNPEQGVRREFEALGLPFSDRATVFEEGLEVLNQAFRTGSVSFKGRYYSYKDVAFYSGTEMAPLRPARVPPIWVVSNPRLVGDKPTEKMHVIMQRACDRIEGGRVGERRPVSRGVADCHLVSSRPPSIRACGSPAHGSPTFFTASIQRARRRSPEGRGGTTVPLRSISPRRSGDWRATAHHPNLLPRRWRMATKIANRFIA
jgi:hypothetical protein